MLRLNAADRSAWMLQRVRARTRKPPATTRMNKLEAAWHFELAKLARDGQIVWHAYEPITLALGGGARYTPDFAIVWHDGEVSFDEVKGFMREAANVRLKVAASRYPFFRFRLVRRGKKGEPAWAIEEVKA